MLSIRAYRQLFLLPVALLVTSILTFRCASDSGGGQQAEPVEGAQGQDGQGDKSSNASLNGEGGGNEGATQGESMNNAVEGGSSENFGAAKNGNSGSNVENTSGDAALGESLNNVPLQNPTTSATTSNTPLNQTAPLTETTPLNAETTTVMDTPPSNVAPLDPAIPQTTPPASNQPASAGAGDIAARAAASPFQNPHMNWQGKGKVKYVTRQLTRHSAPNGPVVGEFEQGEHPLIYQNGNWAELNDGSYVKGNALSEKAVGYSKGKANWK